MTILSFKQVAARRGYSMSTFKREMKGDPDHPIPVDLATNRKGILEEHEEAYQELKFLKKLWLQGKPVAKAMERVRAILHGEDKFDNAA